MTVLTTLVCWRCEQPGHGYTECQREPAATTAERDQRIDRLVRRWQDGQITTRTKRLLVKTEAAAYQKARQAK